MVEALREADDALRLSLEQMIGQSVGDEAWRQAGLRTSEGCLGIRHAEDVSHAAFVGSVVDSAALVLKLLDRDSTSVPHLQRVASECAARLGPGIDMEVGLALGRLEREEVTKETATFLTDRPQRALQDAVETKLRSDLFNMSSANAGDRLEAAARPHAGACCRPSPAKI